MRRSISLMLVLAIVSHASAAEPLETKKQPLEVEQYLNAESTAEKDIMRKAALEFARTTGKPADVKKRISYLLQRLESLQNGDLAAMMIQDTKVKKGQIGPFTHSTVNVLQVTGSDSLLVIRRWGFNDPYNQTIHHERTSQPIMIKGVLTAGMTVDEEIELEGFFRVSGTRTYPTRSGSTTVQVFERFDMDRVRPFLKKRTKEDKQRINVSTEPEFVAAKKLRSARRAVKRHPASARRITKQIIERYPNTWAAGESKKLLSDLSN